MLIEFCSFNQITERSKQVVKILIIDDERDVASLIADAIKDLVDGAVTVCTSGYKVNRLGGLMPEQAEVERLILEHDIIMLDGTLHYKPEHYSGRTLLAFCQKHGKTTIGISSRHELGQYNVHCKQNLIPDEPNVPNSWQVLRAREAFRSAVKQQIERLTGTVA